MNEEAAKENPIRSAHERKNSKEKERPLEPFKQKIKNK
jgi:hypothetical protein